MPYGRYWVTASNHRKTLRDRILIRPLLTLDSTSGRVGDVVSVTLKGYGARESVLITFDTGASLRSVARVRASSSGVATTTFIVPPSTRGSHRVTGTDDSGHSTRASFETRPSVNAESPVAAGDYSDVGLLGFRSGEVVEFHWGSATGSILRTKVVTATGSGFVRVPIPEATTDGRHSLWAIGDQGTRVLVSVHTFGAAEEPTATATATPTSDDDSDCEPGCVRNTDCNHRANRNGDGGDSNRNTQRHRRGDRDVDPDRDTSGGRPTHGDTDPNRYVDCGA